MKEWWIEMEDKELLEVLTETNRRRGNPVDVETLKQILSIVMLNPLDEDRGKSQDQIKYIITKRRWRKKR